MPDRDLARLFAAEPLSEMHRRVLATDWSAPAAGPMEQWSPALLTAAPT